MDRRRPFPSWAASAPAALRLACIVAAIGAPAERALCASPMEQYSGTIIALLTKVVPTVTAIHTRRVLAPDHPDTSSAPKIERAEGSGFIVSSDGLIATNKHVVEGAYDISVSLSDGETLHAKTIYESPVIDVAVIKIEADHPLTAAVIAADDNIKVGERVVAIGNPQGLGISASAGIVSAIDRNLKQSPYDRYIQTDAAINPGNSGGPLFNFGGEVIGMNSISWTAGEGAGSNGLGFAIPGTSITFLVNQLKNGGHIRCGTLGFEGQAVTAPMREALSFPGYHGVIIANIAKNSLAEQAGLKLGDIIESFNGEPLYDATMLNHAACFALGQSVPLAVWRNGKSLPMQVVMTKIEDFSGLPSGPKMVAPPRFAGASDLGLTLKPIDEKARHDFKLPADISGLVVSAVAESSEADVVGLVPGDVIRSLQMNELAQSASFDALFTRLGSTGHRYIVALVTTKGLDRFVTLPVRLESMQAR